MTGSDQERKTLRLELDNLPSLAFSTPVSWRFTRCRPQETDSWRDLYGCVVKYLCKKNADTVKNVLSDSEIGDLKTARKMKVPCWVRRGVYVEAGLTTDMILRRIKKMLRACDAKLSDLEIIYYVDEEKKRKHKERLDNNRSGKIVLQLRWDYVGSYKGSQPVSFCYEKRKAKAVCSWTELYVQVISILAEKFPRTIKASTSFGETRIDICKGGKNSASMLKPAPISQELVLETYGTSSQLIDRLYNALLLCKLDPNILVINFTFRDPELNLNYVGKSSYAKQGENQSGNYDAQLVRRVKFLLGKYFEDGYRLESTIDRSRLCHFYKNQYGEDMPLNGDELVSMLNSVTKPILGKIRSGNQVAFDSLMKTLFQRVSDAFVSGATCIYASELLKIYQRELAEIGIHDKDTIEKLLVEMSGNTYRMYYDRICYGRRKPDVIQEIKNCLKQAGVPQTLDELSSLLWYIPSAILEREIAGEEEIVMVAAKTYYLASSLRINADGRKQIRESIQSFFVIKPVMTELELL